MDKITDPEDPRVLRIHSRRLVAREIDQLLGICELALLDGHVDQGEAELILAWLNRHRGCINTWPASVLYDRLSAMLADGHLNDDEQGELLSLMMSIASPRDNSGKVVPAKLPINNPAPPVLFKNRIFCFTGVFEFGTRADCCSATERLGGITSKTITQKLHYLVIGSVGSEAWKHSSFGDKIAKAVAYRDDGLPIAIIPEEHWAAHLK